MKLFHASEQALTISSYPLKQRFAKWCCRNQLQTCSMGFSSGEYGGIFIMVMLGISAAISSVCHPAPSMTTMAWRPAGVAFEICCKCWIMMSLFTQGLIKASVFPLLGQTAPNRCAYSNCCCLTALGRDPRLAQRRVVVFCWPKRASSWNHISICSGLMCTGVWRIVSSGNFFICVLDALSLFRVSRATGYPTESKVS